MIKKKIFLVLTPIRITYPEKYEGTIIFLGNKDHEYLQSKNPKAVIQKVGTVWSDKKKLFLDNEYLSKLEKIIFKKISSIIDKVNNTYSDEKYWSIFLRPTVFTLLTTLYERWLRIESIIKNYEIENCKFLNFNPVDFTSDDNEKLYEKILYNDYFNHIIFQNILENQNFKFEKVEYSLVNAIEEKKHIQNLVSFVYKIKISNILYFINLSYKKIKNFFLLFLIKNRNFTYINHDINNIELRNKLNLFFKQKNFIFKIKNCKNKIPLDINLRNYLKKSFILKANNEFEIFFQSYIFTILPKIYVENYKAIQKNNSSIVKNFKFNTGIIIYTQLFGNDFCELDWIAKNYMNGAELILAQHGGGEITAESCTMKSMIQNFKFKKLFFGIEDDIKNNTYGVGIYKYKKQKKTFKKDGKIIYALYTPYGYSATIRSNQPIGDEWVSYMKTHEKFLNLLNSEVQKEIILRPKKRRLDYYNFKKKLKKNFPNIALEQHGSRTLKNALVNARLLIASLDTTTILECLAFNFPTILICDFKKFTVSSEYESYYKILQDANILFNDPQEAKIHLEKIFSDVESWWKKNDVQNAREKFCKKFAYHPENQSSYFVNKLSEIDL